MIKQCQDEGNAKASMLTCWYVTGLCERGASFTFYRSKKSFIPIFAIKFDERDEILAAQVQEHFGGVGSLYVTGHKLYFRVVKGLELFRIAEHFRKYPLCGAKEHQFQAWQALRNASMVAYSNPIVQREQRRKMEHAAKILQLQTFRRRKQAA